MRSPRAFSEDGHEFVELFAEHAAEKRDARIAKGETAAAHLTNAKSVLAEVRARAVLFRDDPDHGESHLAFDNLIHLIDSNARGCGIDDATTAPHDAT